jgi:hypothetical protein
MYKATKKIRIEFEVRNQTETEIKIVKYLQNINIDDISFLSILNETQSNVIKQMHEQLNDLPEKCFAFEVISRQAIQKQNGRKFEVANDPTNALSFIFDDKDFLEDEKKRELKWRFQTMTKIFAEEPRFTFCFNPEKKAERTQLKTYLKFPFLNPNIQEERLDEHENIMETFFHSEGIENLECFVCKTKNSKLFEHFICWANMEKPCNHCKTKVHDILKSVIQNGVRIKPPLEESHIIRNLKTRGLIMFLADRPFGISAEELHLHLKNYDILKPEELVHFERLFYIHPANKFIIYKFNLNKSQRTDFAKFTVSLFQDVIQNSN